jgi:hypothetical protein
LHICSIRAEGGTKKRKRERERERKREDIYPPLHSAVLFGGSLEEYGE